jgi:hypothetical protein
MYEAIFNIVEGTTNLPLARMHYLITNTSEAFNNKNTWWQRIFLLAGWSEWNLGMEENEKEQVRRNVRDNNRSLNSRRRNTSRDGGRRNTSRDRR